MKKTLGIFFLLILILLGIPFLEKNRIKVSLVEGDKSPIAVNVYYDLGIMRLHPWYDEESGVWYVFFPSFVQEHVIDCSELERDIFLVNGEGNIRKLIWQDNVLYQLTYQGNDMQVVFLEDKNLPTLFIETESKTNDIIRERKENEEKGYIVSLDCQGKVQHGGNMTISGHGNAWQFYDKRAYDIRLENKGKLAGIESNNRWKLLHLSNDGDKIHSKLAYDIAEILESDYVPQCTWTNVYLNGEYQGMYLLATAVRNQEIFKTEDAVLLEKDLTDRYEIEEHVISKDGNGFTIHRPKDIDESQRKEILNMVQQVEDSIFNGELNGSLIDIDSFVTQFLVEEISLNSDGFKTSCYLYQEANGKPLCAGPPWDYDAGFGEGLHIDKNLTNPAEYVLNGEISELTWMTKLYSNPEFLDKVIKKYESVMSQLEELYTETIDIYAQYIENSVRNDYFRWKGNFQTSPKTGNYQTWENNVRYLKYFCMNRYNALKDRWNIQGKRLVWTGNDVKHTVKILYAGEEKEVWVKDGEILELSQISDFSRREGCRTEIEYSEEEFSEFLPVLEDFAIQLKIKPKVYETESGKYVEILKDMFAQKSVYVSVIDIDSEGNVNNLLIAETMKDLYLEYTKEKTGTIAIYVFSDETAVNVIDEIMITY